MAKGPSKFALVTGASSGIGYEMSKLLASKGYGLALIARSEAYLGKFTEQLRQKYGSSASFLAKDLSSPSSAMEIHDWVLGNNFTIDILVNNAGFGIYGAFAEADPSIIQQLMQVNMASVTSLIRLFLDDMLRRKSGRILNVASTAAFQPGPMMAIYYASKAYVLFLSEALSNELRGTGVTVTALCPGPTRTQFQKRAGIERSNLLRFGMMDARKVAELGYSGMVQGKTIVIPGMLNRMLAQAVRFIPRPAAAALVRRVQEGRNGSK